MSVEKENRGQLILLAVLMTIAVLVLAYEFWPSAPDVATSAGPATAAAPAKPSVRRNSSGKHLHNFEPRLDPTLDLAMLNQTEQIKYEGNGRNIFVAGSVAKIEKPRRSPVTDTQAEMRPLPTIPPPPPITLKFFGFANRPGETKKVFLSQGEDVFIAGEGDIVNRRYRVLRISSSSVDVEDVINNNRQSLPLTQG